MNYPSHIVNLFDEMVALVSECRRDFEDPRSFIYLSFKYAYLSQHSATHKLLNP
jgi:hypothetical protein